MLRFPALPDGLITRPTLRWLLQTATAGKQQVELTYLTGGMTWTADYTILLDKANTKLDLNGWVTLSNTSGREFQRCPVKLVAGDVNRIVETQLEEKSTMTLPTGLRKMGSNVEQRQFFEYQLYEISGMSPSPTTRQTG